MWMRIDEEKIIDKLCEINFESITNDTFSEKEVKFDSLNMAHL